MPTIDTSRSPLVRVRSLSKTHMSPSGALTLLQDVSFEVAAGELLAIVGESGTGKSTLLHLLAAMDAPTSGSLEVDGMQVNTLKPKAQADFRNHTVGYVWQFHYLLPEFTALENVAMPLLARGTGRAEAWQRAEHWLAEVGLLHRAHHRSGELSGGEQQRVSMARALVTEPRLLLADEPTGDLDGRTAETVFALLQRLHGSHNLTSVMVTHNLELAERCHRVLQLVEGALQEIKAAESSAG